MSMETLTLDELVERFCSRQAAQPVDVMERLQAIGRALEVEGWMLLEAVLLDSSWLGSYTILPWGPGCTYKAVPQHPVSPRGLASDTSVVVAVAKREG